MDNSRGKRNGLIWGLWLGLSVMGGASVYYYPVFVLTMLAVPAVWATMAFRTHPVMIAVAGALVFLFGRLTGCEPLNCLCIVGMVVPAGWVLWFSQREGMGNFQSVMYVSVLLTFGLFLIFCVPDLLSSGDPYASLRSSLAMELEMFKGMAMYEQAQYILGRLDEMMVACFYAFAGVYALVNVLLLHAFNRGKRDMPLCPLGPFGTWSASYGYVMVSGALTLISTLLTAIADTPMVTTLNLLLYEMWALPLMLTGVNCLYALLSRRLPRGRARLLFWVTMGAGMVLLYQIFQMVLLLLGLVEVIRRRRAGKEQG